MEPNAELTSILRDTVQFLECLRDAKLPASLENIRDNLLVRSRDTLTMLVVERIGRPASAEPYLNMSAAGSKGLMASLRKEADLQEYVGAEEHQRQLQKQQQQDYYETFQTVEPANNAALWVHDSATPDRLRDKTEEIENALVDIYANFSAAQTRSKCQICGSLYRKEGKKLFVFEQYRACWVGLVGLHLLIYGSDRDSRPCTILSIRGYMARAAPNAIPRDQRRSESTFEIFRPGSRTFQFVARSPKDMVQWVTKICELGGEERSEHKYVSKAMVDVTGNTETFVSNDREDAIRKEERYQDVGSPLGIDKLSEEHSIVTIEINGNTGVEADESFSNDAFLESAATPEVVASPLPPPSPPSPPSSCPSSLSPLSSRIVPRKLPSLPVPPSSYEFLEEEEDDIYHKIEDYRDTIRYGNVGEPFHVRSDDNRSSERFVTYDDVRVNAKPENKVDETRNKKDEVVATKSGSSHDKDTYDDTAVIEPQRTKIIDHRDEFVSYDDVENVLLTAKTTKVRATVKADEPAKSPQKKSFLYRVRSKKESTPRKVERKVKHKTPQTPAPTINDQLSATCYDDVSDLTNVHQETHRFEEEQSEYTCPPPPRPIYIKPPTIVDAIDSHEFYDDVAAYREKPKNDDEISKSDQQSTKNSTRMDADRTVFCENVNYSQGSSPKDNEHYKTPRVESRNPRCHYIDQGVEDLYDDIAILAEFTARQKESLARKDCESATRSQGSPEKKPWNRFVSGKKLKTTDATVAETSGRNSSGIEDTLDDFGEHHGSMRMNTFQKLISRMESSLGKASLRSASSMLLSKTNATNNV